MTGQVIRVAVVDDHPVFRLGMTALLASTVGLEVVGEAPDADGALRVAELRTPDVIIMDLHLGGRSGVEATREIVARHPGIGVLVVTMLDDDDWVFAALRAGARGYLLKGAAPAEVERAVRAVANGEVLLGPVVASRAVSFLSGARAGGAAPFPELTDREREVLDLVAQGLSNLVIARRLTLSPKTVRNHLSNVLSKLQVADRSQAIQRARQAGLGQL
ncbi:response regulator transcription factor [Micromonospora mirobrigensis]|uniref:Two component transcriptional regulator, LuxR family n=1 Tax=Micromonospora mirobrigensis TaxID=262898 RepID=A0A1C5AHQ6_9ACTN|nr:response regulator transcription factor [Micromonospora mirobrigensis]SCF44601.1 two component transcriptional regulator, LuxR family [Micromonospora mirobrigensis]